MFGIWVDWKIRDDMICLVALKDDGIFSCVLAWWESRQICENLDVIKKMIIEIIIEIIIDIIIEIIIEIILMKFN